MNTRVLIGIPCLLKGGTEYQTLHLTNALIGLGYTVEILCYFEYDDEMVKTFERAKAQVSILKWSRTKTTLDVCWGLYRYIRKAKPDILHVQYVAPGALPILAGKLAGIKHVIATVHQPYTTASHGAMAKRILLWSAKLTNYFMVVSKNAEKSWFGTSQEISEIKGSLPRHFTLYNTIPVAVLQHIGKEKSMASLFFSTYPDLQGKIVIGTVSRMRYEKGIDILLHAFAKLSEEERTLARLVLIGDGPGLEELQVLAGALGVAEQVIFWGAAEWNEAMALMALLDIVVVPSRFEGFGLTAAEAKAMGKPLIVADNFGLSELVDHAVDGLVFRNEDVEALTNCLLQYLHSPSFGQELAEKGHMHAKQMYDWLTFVKNIERVYKKLT